MWSLSPKEEHELHDLEEKAIRSFWHERRVSGEEWKWRHESYISL